MVLLFWEVILCIMIIHIIRFSYCSSCTIIWIYSIYRIVSVYESLRPRICFYHVQVVHCIFHKRAAHISHWACGYVFVHVLVWIVSILLKKKKNNLETLFLVWCVIDFSIYRNVWSTCAFIMLIMLSNSGSIHMILITVTTKTYDTAILKQTKKKC